MTATTALRKVFDQFKRHFVQELRRLGGDLLAITPAPHRMRDVK